MSRRIAHARHMTGSAISGREASLPPPLEGEGEERSTLQFHLFNSITNALEYWIARFRGRRRHRCGPSAFVKHDFAFSRHQAPELYMNLSPNKGVALPLEGSGRYPKKGAGNAGCPLH